MSILSRVKSLFGFKKVDDESELVSVVLLLAEPLQLSEQVLNSAVTRAWGRELQKEKNEYVVFQKGRRGSQLGVINFDRIIMLVNNFGGPYISPQELPEVLRNTREMRTYKALSGHTSWVSFDLTGAGKPKKREKALFYSRACALAAEFVEVNCLGVLVPETNELRPYDNLVREALLASDPLSALRQWDPVALVESENSRMDGAMAEAKRRWLEFEEAFQNRRPGQRFAVKARFSDGKESEAEWMWVEITALSGDVVEGKLLNKPVHIVSVHEGDIVRVPASTLGDWMYNDGREPRGGFTEKVLSQPRRK